MENQLEPESMDLLSEDIISHSFEFDWEDPQDSHLHWTLDEMQCPDPVTPMSHLFMRHMYEHGFNEGALAYDLPFRFQARRINTFHYGAVIRLVESLGEFEIQISDAEKKMQSIITRLGDFWMSELLPEVKQNLIYWRNFNLRDVTMADLLDHLDQTIARARRLGEIHFLIGIPMLLAMSMFEESYNDLFESRGTLNAYRLLQGFNTKTLELSQGLWDLSRRAESSVEVRSILLRASSADFRTELEKFSQGRVFLRRFDAFLNEHGQRADKYVELSDPSWIEDPSPAIHLLKSYLHQDSQDPRLSTARMSSERIQLIADARDHLKRCSKNEANQFEVLLKAAQAAIVISEDHSYWIDFRTRYEVRRVLLELGTRLRHAKVIEDPNDIFYLTVDELRESSRLLSATSQFQLVYSRKKEMERYRRIKPPASLGSSYGELAPDTRLGRAIAKYSGSSAPSTNEPNMLTGTPASPGVARGAARVIRSLSEIYKVKRGDILVAGTTAPQWTPLFAIISAVVTDTGGVLSHCAIVAREYAVPAVVGTKNGTAIIRDDQLLEVNGSTGVVRIL